MMATALPLDQSAAARSSSPIDLQQTQDSHNADVPPPTVNGGSSHDAFENKRVKNIDDRSTSADVSTSGGSDTENLRTDSPKPRDDDKSHNRTGSTVKKPASFKAVSVNKKFLKTSATPPSKPVEAPSPGPNAASAGPTSIQLSRPRLIAKTGSGTRDSTPRLSGAPNGVKPATGPDPNVVWNKNRPPEPKVFTDEELKKYGIHMASRLEEDDTQGQNKWADIDDDDEDWAPAAITWGDGTKTTLPHPDEMPPQVAETVNAVPEDRALGRPRSPAPIGQSSPSTSRAPGLASGKGMILRNGPQEKPVLVAKPQQPQTQKSPWASVQPVQKASPGGMPEPSTMNRPFGREGQMARNYHQPYARDLPMDDFSRSGYREAPSYGHKELFNPQSGRSEPVVDRRGSLRTEQTKYPAVLQRPAQPSQPPGPPGTLPSSNRPVPEAIGRRRGSSNVSGGSGPMAPRSGRGSEYQSSSEAFDGRRGSLAGSIDAPMHRPNFPANHQDQARHERQGDNMSPRTPNVQFAGTYHSGMPPQQAMGPSSPMGPPLIPAPVLEEEVETQKKLMKEKVELARKRRQEEEAREDAAKKERIRKKLEGMGHFEKAAPTPKETPIKPTQIQQREPSTSQPAPSALKAPTQQESAPGHANVDHRQDSAATQSTGSSKEKSAVPPTKTRRPSQSQDARQSEQWVGHAQRPERISTWAPGAPGALPPPPTRNVWGSPDNDRGLGNGTFNPDLGRPGVNLPPPPAGKGPSPIAPPSVAAPAVQGRRPQQAPVGPRSRYGVPNSDVANKWVTAVANNDQQLAASRRAEHAERERQLAERGLTTEDLQPVIKDTWRPVRVGDGTRSEATTEVHSTPHPSIAQRQQPAAESWKSTREEPAQSVQMREPPRQAANAALIGSSPSSLLAQPSQGTSPQSRPSRFFPTRDIRTELPPARPHSPSLPPPTMEGHPAYEGDATHPHVSLPKPSNPKPVVKLPPSMGGSTSGQASQQGPSTYSGAVRDTSRAMAQAQQSSNATRGAAGGNWQNRINNLLSGKSPHAKYLVVDAASRNALDHSAYNDAATVSLPSTPLHTSTTGKHDFTFTKPMAEDCFEEQEMGSLPLVRFPGKTPDAAWHPAPMNNKPMPKRFWIQATSRENLYCPSDHANAVRVHLPGMRDSKVVHVPGSPSRGGRGGSSRSTPRQRGSGPSARGAKRDSPSTNDTPSPPAPSRGGRGAYRSRASGSWNRTRTEQVA